MAQQQLKSQAMEMMDQGKKLSTKSWFRWSTDFVKAADCYASAAKKFQAMGAAPQQGEAHLRAAECYEEINSLSTAGKHYSQAGAAFSESNRLKSVDCYCRAKDVYFASGQIPTAASQLEKAAKGMEESNVETAFQYYKEAVYLLIDNDKEIMSHDMFKSAIGFACQHSLFRKAISLLREQNKVFSRHDKPLRLAKNCLAIVVVLLHLNEPREASEALLGFPAEFANTEEFHISDSLITAFEELDEEKLEEAKSKPSVRLIETHVARLVKGLHLPAGTQPFLKTRSRSKSSGDDDEDELDLT